MSTRAIKFLKKSGTIFEVIKYSHEKKGADFAAMAIGFPIEKTIKTLIVNVGEKEFIASLMPGDKKLDLKKLAKELEAKRCHMADTATAERVTGYFVGGISPFGLKKPLRTVMERTITAHDSVVINGGQRGIMLKMAPQDIVAVLGCKVLDISVGS